MKRTNKDLFNFINSLDVDTYVVISLKYGLYDFRYEIYISLNGFEVAIYLETLG